MTKEQPLVLRDSKEIEARLAELWELAHIYNCPANARQCAREAAAVYRSIVELEWVLGSEKPRD